jgi:hypothetical protein
MLLDASLNLAQVPLAQMHVTLRRLQVRMAKEFRQREHIRAGLSRTSRGSVTQIIDPESTDLAFPQRLPVRWFKFGHRL